MPRSRIGRVIVWVMAAVAWFGFVTSALCFVFDVEPNAHPWFSLARTFHLHHAGAEVFFLAWWFDWPRPWDSV